MTKEKEKEIKMYKYERILITTEGKEVVVEYELDEDIDDYILEKLRNALEKNEICCCDEVIVTINGVEINELDFKKIIGIRWDRVF